MQRHAGHVIDPFGLTSRCTPKMLDKLKDIQLPPLPADKLAAFCLDSAEGRDELANQIEADIDKWCQLQYEDGPRSHLGASIIGHECERYIWFSFHWMY